MDSSTPHSTAPEVTGVGTESSSTAAGGATTAAFTFSECVAHYKGYRQGMCMTRGDPDVLDLYQDARNGAISVAAQLNALVGVTPDVSFHMRAASHDPHNTTSGVQENDEEQDEDRIVILFPASAYQEAAAAAQVPSSSLTVSAPPPPPWPTSLTTNCPFEIFYDDREWLSCVILEMKPPTTDHLLPGMPPPPPAHSRGGITGEEAEAYDEDEHDAAVALWRYTVAILGYNTLVEEVNAISLRPFAPDANLLASVESGRRCFGVHPGHHGDFWPCTIQRLTIQGTVMVIFDEQHSFDLNKKGNQSHSSSSNGTPVELPLSHIHLGKVYKSLQRIHQLTDEERSRRRAELAARKRERAEAARKAAMGRVATAANDWKNTLNDLMLGGSSSSTPQNAKKKSGATGNIKRRPR